MTKGPGWRKESYRHRLASKKVKTTIKPTYQNKLAREQEQKKRPHAIIPDRFAGLPWDEVYKAVEKGCTVHLDTSDELVAHVIPPKSSSKEVMEHFAQWGIHTHDDFKKLHKITNMKQLAKAMSKYA